MKTKQDITYDFAIVGSGLGGLQCAYILAQEGYKVVVLEKNRQLGGSLQVFSRNKHIFDTGVHYIGSLDEGQNLNQFFKYFGIMQNVQFKKLDKNGFDQIQFKGSDKKFFWGQGYENFEKILVKDFPKEEKAIKKIIKKIKEISADFPLYNLIPEVNLDYYNSEYHRISISSFMKDLTSNKKLQNVLLGSAMLYGGVEDETPLYMFALIINSYIKSAYRVKDGGSKIAVHLGKQIRQSGGKIITNNGVVSSNLNEENEIVNLVLKKGNTISAKKFIFNIPPKQTIKLIGKKYFKKAFVNRINSQKPGVSSFSLHLTLKENTIKYQNFNLYYFKEDDVWKASKYKNEDWPNYVLVSMPYSSKTTEYTRVLSVISYMNFAELEPWLDSHKTDSTRTKRDQSYLDWKKKKENLMIDFLESEIYPNIKSQIKHVESSTPLSYRDYIGNSHGAMYGIAKDYKNPIKSFVNARTRVSNLFLTGQYLNLHGVLGVTISSFITCFEFIDKNKLIEKVKQAK